MNNEEKNYDQLIELVYLFRIYYTGLEITDSFVNRAEIKCELMLLELNQDKLDFYKNIYNSTSSPKIKKTIYNMLSLFAIKLKQDDIIESIIGEFKEEELSYKTLIKDIFYYKGLLSEKFIIMKLNITINPKILSMVTDKVLHQIHKQQDNSKLNAIVNLVKSFKYDGFSSSYYLQVTKHILES